MSSLSRMALLACASRLLEGVSPFSCVRRRKSETIQTLIIDSVELVAFALLGEPEILPVRRSSIAHE